MERHLTGQKYPWVHLGEAGIEANEFDGGMWPEGHGGASTARGFFGHTTSVLFLVFVVTPDWGGNVWFARSVDLFHMPASPVCRDTLVSATVGAAKNPVSGNVPENLPSSTNTVPLVSVTTLNGLVSSDITHPLLLSGNSHKLLMRELFPQSKQKASTFKNS